MKISATCLSIFTLCSFSLMDQFLHKLIPCRSQQAHLFPGVKYTNNLKSQGLRYPSFSQFTVFLKCDIIEIVILR